MEEFITAINDLVEVQRLNSLRIERLISLLERSSSKSQDWLKPDEVCEKLGFPVTPTGNRKRLRWCREEGLLTRYSSHRPYTYCAKEVNELAERIRNKQVEIPSF